MRAPKGMTRTRRLLRNPFKVHFSKLPQSRAESPQRSRAFKLFAQKVLMDITYNHTIAMRMYRIRIKASNKMQTNKPACPHAQMGV